MTDTHTTAHIPDEAIHAALLSMAQDNIGADVQGLLMHGFDKLNAKPNALRNALAAALPHLSAPCAVEAAITDEAIIDLAVSFSSYKERGYTGIEYEVISHRNLIAFVRRILSCVVTKPVDVLTPAEAIFGLLGWLTSRNETVALGSSHGAAIGAELAAEFCKVNNLGDCRDSFPKNLKHPTTTASQPVDVAAVRRQAFEEGFENGVEQSLNALDAYDDITRNEAEQSIRKLKPDYRALSAGPVQGCGND